jgi:hypothetical protein
MNKIQAALMQLDGNNDAHWTTEGLPRLDTVRFLAGDATISRDAVTNAASEFTRLNRKLPSEAPRAPAVDPQAATQAAPTADQGVSATLATIAALVAVVAPDTSEVDHEQAQAGQGDVAADGVAGAPSQQEATDAEDKLARARERVAAAQGDANEATAYLAKATAELDALLDAQATATPASLTTDIQLYQARVKAELRARGERKQAMAALGIKLSDLFPGASKLDRSFQRNRDPSAQRKQFTPDKE